jgi:hypothetical protein
MQLAKRAILQLLKSRELSILKVLIGPRSFITPAHSTMARAGRRWLSLGSE